MPAMPRRFRYCLDPVFVAAVILYDMNKGLFEPLARGHTNFFQFYLNDLICFPFCLPPVLFAYRVVRIRDHDPYPTRFEMLTHLVVWSLFFEGIGPALKGPFAWSVADPWDVVAYAVGAAVSGWFWGTWRRSPRRASIAQASQREEATP